jgi:uncharacterized protein (TIRG00374 family)
MRKTLIAVVLLLAIILIIGQFAEVQAIVETLQRGDWRYILMAMAVEMVWLLNIAASYQAIYSATGLSERIEKLVLLAAAANFVNVVAPTVGMGGMAIFISEANKRGYSSGRVTAAGVLFVLLDYFGFLTILSLGLLVLFRRNNLRPPELVATAILVLIASGLALLLHLGNRSAEKLGRTLAWMGQQVNNILKPFLHKDYLEIRRAYEFAQDIAASIHDLRRSPKRIALPITLAISSKVLLISILCLVFMAFKVPFSAGTLVAGFSIGYLFFIVSPTPSGIGIVEGALTLGLRSLNVPLGEAAVVALAYRGVTFWFPLLIGLGAFRYISSGREAETTI